MGRLYKTIKWIGVALPAFAIIAAVFPVFICDRFKISGTSMEPTLSHGEYVWVNKLLMGARIYKDFDFSSPDLSSFRMPGIRKIRVNDMAVFNCPYGWNREKIEFRINYVYAKRCLGCPGDTIGIDNGVYYNTEYCGPIGVPAMQLHLQETPDSLIPPYAIAAYPYSSDLGWTIRQLGPLTVPSEGMTVDMNKANTRLFAHIIEYETGIKPVWSEGGCKLGNAGLESYTFRDNYYYFVGDNVLDSKDSRYFGFVPEDFIIGIVSK